MRYILVLTTFLVLSGINKADVVYNNLNTGQNLSENFGSTYTQWAQKFTLTSSTSTLDYIALNLFQTSSTSAGTFSVSIFGDNGTGNGKPVTPSLATLASGVSISSLGGTETSTWSMGGGINLNTTLNAGNYWIVVASSTADTNFKWAIGPATPSYISASTNGTTWIDSTNVINFGGQIAVPEPGTLLLGGIAAACGGSGVWWKRRKRQPQPETTEQPAAI